MRRHSACENPRVVTPPGCSHPLLRWRSKKVIGEIDAGHGAIEDKSPVLAGQVAFVHLQVAEFSPELKRMPAQYLGNPVRYGVGVVGLERDQGGRTDGEVVEVELGHILRISGIGIGDNPLRTETGHETQRGKRSLSTRRVVQVGRRAEEGQARLIHSGRSENLGVTYDKLLGASGRPRREARHACAAARQGAENGRIVEVVIERPVARLAIVEVDPLSDLVVRKRISLAIVEYVPAAGSMLG